MTLNVLVGGEDRLDALCAIVAGARPDVLVLQECVGWEDRVRLGRVAAAMGAPAGEAHAVLGASNPRGSGIRYNVCLVSRSPITRHQVHTAGLAHCAVEAEIDGVTVLGTHLVAGSETARVAEVDVLLGLVAPRAASCALAGDLNGLARHDPYPLDLGARFVRAGIEKYGLPPRFDTLDHLLAGGWIDALHERPSSPRWVTAVRGPTGATVDTRTDYVLVSPALAPRLTGAEVIDVGSASDHHAVLAHLS
jgi:exodeoxyribonuclease III